MSRKRIGLNRTSLRSPILHLLHSREGVADSDLDCPVGEEVSYPAVHVSSDAEFQDLEHEPLDPDHVVGLGEIQEDADGELPGVDGVFDLVLESHDLVEAAPILPETGLVSVVQIVGLHKPVESIGNDPFIHFTEGVGKRDWSI